MAPVVRRGPARQSPAAGPGPARPRPPVRAGDPGAGQRRPARRARRGRASRSSSRWPAYDRVLEVVHRVGDVVRPVHDLRLEAAPPVRRALRAASGRRRGRRRTRRTCGCRSRRGHGYLHGGVQRRPGQVEADAAPVRRERLGLQPGQDPQALRVALEAAAARGHLVERRLAGVPERRVAEVVRQAGGLDQVGVAAERLAELAADLRALQRVGQPGAREVALPRARRPGSWRPAGAAPTSAAPAPGRARTRVRPGALRRLLDPALLAARARHTGRQTAFGPESALRRRSGSRGRPAVSRAM